MSTLLSSSINVSVFSVHGLPPLRSDEIFAFMQAELQRFAFRGISDTSEEQSIGWVQIEDRMQTGFESPAYVLIDKFAFLSLRKDVRKVPAAVLKQEVADRSAAWLSEHPNMKRPPKRVREEIADAAKLHLLGKTLPVPKVLDAAWNIESGLLYVLSASQSELDLFCDMFHRTFDGVSLLEYVPYERALGAAAADRNVVDAVIAANRATSGALIDVMHSNIWIGQNLALWFMTGTAMVPDVSVWVDDKVALSGEGRKAVFSGSVDNNLVALRSSVTEGNSVSDVVVHMEHSDGDIWRFNLNTETFRMRSVKFPAAKIDYHEDAIEERQATMLCRVDSLQRLMSCFHACLFKFLRGRLTSGDVMAAIEEWRSASV